MPRSPHGSAGLARRAVVLGLGAGMGLTTVMVSQAWAQAPLVDNPALRGAAAPPVAPVSPAFPERALDRATLLALRLGGHVLYMRHGETDNARADQVPVDFNNCASQRVLNEAGRVTARHVGVSLRKARIPVGALVASPMCRTVETARLVVGREPEVDPLLAYTGQLTSEQKAPRIARLRELMSRPVPHGGNRFIVAHGPNLMDLIGYFPKEGVLSAFANADGSFRYLGSIAPTDWDLLLKNT